MANVQEKLREAFPNLYYERIGYHKVTFEHGATIYSIKSKAHILESCINNLPNGAELRDYLHCEGIRVINRPKAPQYEIHAEYMDGVIAIIRG